VLYEWDNDVLRGRSLDKKRENDESDMLNADSAKRSDKRVGVRRDLGVRGGRLEGTREQEMATERRGKTSEKQRQTRRWG